MAAKYFWIMQRHNPQFIRPYYVGLGQISVQDAKRYEAHSLHGYNCVQKYATKELYDAELQRLKDAGFQVQ